MYDFCAKHNVPFRHTGKLVVAADATRTRPPRPKEERRYNGVEGLRLIGPEEIRAREPHIAGIAALDVPSPALSPPKISPHLRPSRRRPRPPKT